MVEHPQVVDDALMNGADEQGGAAETPERPGAPVTGAATRRLVRPRQGRMIAGVAAGVARSHGWDPTIVRLGMVLVALVTAGVAVVGYVAAWIIIPEEGAVRGEGPPRRPGGAMIAGLVLLGLGATMVLDRLDLGPGGDFYWPLALILGGVAVLWLRGRDTPAACCAATGTPSTEVSAGTASAWPAPATPWPAAPSPPGTPTSRAPRPRPFLGPVTISLLLILVGCAWLADTSGALDVSAGAVVAAALVALGAALVIGAWFGRARGLVGLAVPLTVVAALLSVADLDLRGGIGERTYAPADTAALRDRYDLAMGSLDLDLRRVAFDPGVTEIDVSVDMGEIVVWVPDDVTVEVDGHVGAGELTVWGRSFDGASIDETLRAGAGGDTLVHIEADVGLGTIEVHRLPPIAPEGATSSAAASIDPEETLE